MENIKDDPIQKLDAIMRARSQSILEKFAQVAVSGVSNRELLSMLNYVRSYWFDRLRPTLLSFCCEAVGAQSKLAIDAGVMLALLDAGISIHDDIVDNTLRKHFRRTIFGKYGINNALLVGDLLIVKAWSLIHEMIRKTDNPMIIAAFAETYGKSCLDMCEAELDEISCRKDLKTELKYREKMLWKLNSGIKACAQLGAIIGDGTKKEIIALTEVGKSIALIIGMMDEIRDTLSVEGYLLHRIEYESIPLPLLYAANTSEKHRLRIKSIIKKTFLTSKDLKELLSLCFETKAFDFAYAIAKQEAENAIAQLNSLKQNDALNVLKLIVNASVKNIEKLLPSEIHNSEKNHRNLQMGTSS